MLNTIKLPLQRLVPHSDISYLEMQQSFLLITAFEIEAWFDVVSGSNCFFTIRPICAKNESVSIGHIIEKKSYK